MACMLVSLNSRWRHLTRRLYHFHKDDVDDSDQVYARQ